MRHDPNGFTLVELMVVILIVGVLAAVAIPKFTAASQKAKASEFPTVLTRMHDAEHTFQVENGSYGPMASISTEVSVPANGYFLYDIVSQNATRFSAQAEVVEAIGNAVAGTTAAIDMNGSRTAQGYLSTYCVSWK